MRPGSVLVLSERIDATGANIPASSGDPLEIEALTSEDINSLLIFNSTAGDINLYMGPNTALELLMIIPGPASPGFMSDRITTMIPKNVRLSVRAAADSALSTGRLVINGWV